jgi:geranyl diphosphate synthase
MDPFQLVKEELDSVSERLRRSIFTGIPTLRSAAQYFFKARPCSLHAPKSL